MDKIYRIFVNGAFFNGSDDYNFAMSRAFGLAIHNKMEFVNTKSKLIVDKWVGRGDIGLIIITKNVPS